MRSASVKELAFMQALVDQGYIAPRPIDEHRYAALHPLMFTHAIITGRIGDADTYDDRWCYHDRESAEAALNAWDGTGEPEGWHRHPLTGRRRDGTKEWVAM